MRIQITPTYSDIFDGPIPEMEDLMVGIPSHSSISILSSITAELYSGKGIESQEKIFKTLTHRQPATIKNKILNNASRLRKRTPDDPIYFFSILFNMEFMHYELLNYRDFDVSEMSPEQDLCFFKAYLLISQRVNNNYSNSFEEIINTDPYYFPKKTWPILIDQFEINQPIDPGIGMIRGAIFFTFLEFYSPYGQYVRKFLALNEKEKSWNYILDLMNVLKISWGKPTTSQLYPFSLKKATGFKTLFDNFTMDVQAYQKEYVSEKRNFTGIKDKPLFHYNNENMLVLNWNFISNKLYDGLLFDFHKYSGINSEKGFLSFRDFKAYVSEEITEKFVFRRTIKKYLFEKHSVLKFDDKKEKGFPDAYYRHGKYIFIIEFKDALFPAKPVNSYSYIEIKNAIDNKYNNNGKGTGQLIKNLLKLKSKSFEEKDYTELGLKRQNLVIYPIIIYTDKFLSMPGVNYYLKSEFKEMLRTAEMNNHFGTIKDLTLINLSFLIDGINSFEGTNFHLKDVIDYYHTKIKEKERKHSKEYTEDALFEFNENFETTVPHKLRRTFYQKGYVETIFDTFDLMKSLHPNT